MIKQVPNSNGLEAYGLLIEPASENRSLTMLLEWGQFDMRKGNLLNQLLRLEEAFADNEKTGSKLEDTIKLTILMKCV